MLDYLKSLFSVPLLHAKYALLENEATQLRVDFNESNANLKRMTSLHREACARARAAEASLDDLAKQYAALSEMVESVKSSQAELRTAIDNEARSNEVLNKDNDRLTKLAADSIEKSTSLQQDVRTLQIALQKSEDKNDILQDRIKLFETSISLNHTLVESLIQLTLTAGPSNGSTTPAAVGISGQGASPGAYHLDEVRSQ